MFIVGNDMEGFRDSLKQAMVDGNESVVYNTDKILNGRQDLFFFQKGSDAESFCFIHGSMGEYLASDDISNMLEILNQVSVPDDLAGNIEYYFFAGNEVYTNLGRLKDGSIEAIENRLSAEMLSDLVTYPLKEFFDENSAGKLIHLMQQYGGAAVQVERGIVPADHIDQYFLIKHHYPTGGTIYEKGHALHEIEQFADFDQAQKVFYQRVMARPDDNADLMLIGKYEGKILQHDLEGNLYPSNGYQAAVAYVCENALNEKEYKVNLFPDPRLATTIRENLRIEASGWSNAIHFLDVFGSDRQIDKFFWQEQFQPVQNFNSLSKQLKYLEFPELIDELQKNFWEQKTQFIINGRKTFNEDQMQFDLHYQRNQKELYVLTKYVATLEKAIRLEEGHINGVDVKNLDRLMGGIDWRADISKTTNKDQVAAMKHVADQLQQLDPKTRICLKAKHWTNTAVGVSQVEQDIMHLLARLNRYKHTFHCKGVYDTLNASTAYQVLLNYSVQTEKVLDLANSITHLSSLKNTTMNKDNVEFLKNGLKYSGFGEELNAQLEAKIASGVPEFTLDYHKEMKNRQFDAVLHYRKGSEGNMYFFNKYDATLTKANGQQLDQTFYMERGRGFTRAEAFNLLDGRSVFKDLVNQDKQEYTAWVKLDFTKQKENGNYEMKRYTENYGYDIVAAVDKLGSKEMLDASKREEKLKSLEKGNVVDLTLPNDEKIWVAANPESGKANKLVKYDENGREVELRNVPPKQSQANEQPNKEQKKEVIQDNGATQENGKKKVKQSKEAKNGADSLLPKKRESPTGKGQRV